MHFPTDMTVHTTTFDGPVVDHWLEWKVAQIVNAFTMQARSHSRTVIHNRTPLVTARHAQPWLYINIHSHT